MVRMGCCSSALEAMSLCFINSWSQRLRLCREIASALAACHAAGVVHRDLTSFNIMLSEMQDVQPGAQSQALCWRDVVRPVLFWSFSPPPLYW
jgi:serine/threonine protein kinase